MRNNAYYERFGFEMKKEISLKRGPVPVVLYIMVREPSPSKPAYASHVLFRATAAAAIKA